MQAQLRRILRQTALTEGLVNVRVQTDGGPQAMPALTLDVLPGWLFGIDEHRVKPDTRQDVIVFQRECVRVLAHHFAAKQRPMLPRLGALVPAEPMAQPVSPRQGASREEWQQWRQAMRVWLDWQDELDAWREGSDQRQQALALRQDTLEQRQDALEDRTEGVEELSRLFVEVTERLGPETLSPEHQATVKNLAQRLNELAGFSYAAIYGELNAAFHVGKYSDIPAARWPDVLAWFKRRVDAAERRHPH